MPPHAAQLSEQALLENRDFLRLLARRLVWHDAHAAEDVVQEAWLAALERPPRFEGPLRAWLARVVRNLAFTALQREGERQAREGRAARAESVELDEERDFEQQQLVVESVRALRQPYRSTIYLRYWRELSPKEIARLQGISVATVKTRLRRGLELLREDLDRRHAAARSRWCVALAPFAGLGGIAPPYGALPAASLLKGLILMNKTVLTVLSVFLLSALAAVAWFVSRPPEGGDAPPQIAAPAAPEEAEGGDGLEGAAGVPRPDGGARPGVERTALAAGPGTDGDDAARVAPRLVGRVLDDLGRPIEGADVAVFSDDVTWIPAAGAGDLRADRRAETKSDAEGRFELPVDGAELVHLSVGADGFAPFRKELALGEGRGADAGDLRLDPGVFLSGRVIDSSGRAVVGAEVRRPLRSALGEMVVFGDLDPTPVVATTDGAGGFRVARQAVGPWKLRFQHEDHPAREVEGQTDHAGERASDLVVTLPDGFRISGRVVDRPAEETDPVFVRAVPVSEEAGSSPGLGQLAALGAPTAPVAADGTFELRGLEGGTSSYRLQVRTRGVPFGGSSRSAAVEARPGDRGVTLVWSAPAALVFRVVDAATGAPLTDFEVRTGSAWLSPEVEDGAVKHRWPEGLVRLESFRQGLAGSDGDALKVEVAAIGYETFERAGLVLTGSDELDLGVVRLERIPVVRVEVRDDRTGAPLEGAAVSLCPEGEDLEPGVRTMSVRMSSDEGSGPMVYTDGPQPQTGSTDASGLCVLNSLPGQAAVIRVRAEDRAPYASEVLELPRVGDLDHRVRLVEGSTLEVLVVDVQGRPLPGLRVQHRAPIATPWSVELATSSPSRSRVSDSEGRVLFANLEEGVHRFRLVEDPFESGEGPGFRTVGGPEPEDGWQERLVAPGDEPALTLVAAPRGDLEGVVTEAGAPLTGATLRLLSADEEPDDAPSLAEGPSTTTDSKGRYRFENLKADEYRLEVAHESRAMPWVETLDVRAGQNEEDLDLPVTLVEGRVVDARGEPVAGARVTVERWRETAGGVQRRMVRMVVVADGGGGASGAMLSVDGPRRPEVLTDEKGYYALRGVRTDYPLVVKASGEGFAQRSSEKLELVEGEDRRGVDLAVQPAGAVEVVLRKPDGSPASGLLVRGTYLGEADEPVEPLTAFADPEGTARLAGCLEGRWRVSFTAVAFPGQEKVTAPEPREVQVKAAETQRLEVTVE